MTTDNWHHAYREGWGKRLVPEAYAHPAKVSYSLAQRIYEHAIAEGWLKAGDCLIDPFAGIGGFAYHAMYHGLNFVGVELEQRFVDLGQQNIARWNARYSTLPGWRTATLLQGDSRRLAAIVGEAAGCISSPPFVNYDNRGDRSQLDKLQEAVVREGRAHAGRLGPSIGQGYGTDPANVGNMRPGNLDAVLSSPPYADSIHDGNGIDPAKLTGNPAGKHSQAFAQGYGSAVISSPPYADGCNHMGGDTRITSGQGGPITFVEYGVTDGQLGAMPAGGFEAAVSSPPMCDVVAGRGQDEFSKSKGLGQDYDARLDFDKRGFLMGREEYAEHARTCNLGSFRDPTPSFWEAARTIVEQVYTVLRPGAHAIWVLKAYVRDKQIVDFPDQWRQMCEACGFETLHVHRAWLVEDHGAQGTLDGGVKRKRTERKSFFRRLAESKGSPRIDYEIVLCQVKPVGTGSQSGQASACVASPPYTGQVVGYTAGFVRLDAEFDLFRAKEGLARRPAYGSTPGNLGNMKPGDFDGVLKPLNSNGKGDTQ